MKNFLSRVFTQHHEQQPHDDIELAIRQQACKEVHERMLRSKQVFSGILSLFPDGKPGSRVIELGSGRVVFHHVSEQEVGGSLIEGKTRTHLGMVESRELTTLTLQAPDEGLTIVQFHDEDDKTLKVTVADANTPTTSVECKSRLERIEMLASLFGEVAVGRVA